jgi:hypothetical protein
MVRICFKGIFFSSLYVCVTLEHFTPHGSQVAHTEIYFRGTETMLGGGVMLLFRVLLFGFEPNIARQIDDAN